MFGNNPKRPPEKGDGSTLLVQEIFPTLQGEGPHTGRESIFIRLGGCNLACDFCDTEFENFEPWSLDEVVDEVVDLSQNSERGQQAEPALSYAPCERQHVAQRGQSLIVITGGEPLRQNIVPLCERLIANGYTVQIETNGTLWRDLPTAVEIICSPKATDGRYHTLRPDVLARVTALKFIISTDRAPYNTLPPFAQEAPTWLQPMDEGDAIKNQRNLDYAIELAMQHGYFLSLQTHKLFNLD